MKRVIRSDQRGFTMMTTTVLVAVVGVSALLVLDVISLDFSQISRQRQTVASREAAEGGLMELLNDQDVMSNLPTPRTPNMKMSRTPTGLSVFGQSHQVKGDRSYSADIEMVRQVPLLESSHSTVRAMVYDVRVEASASGGNSARVQAEVFRITASKPGTVQPRMHAR